MRLILFSVIFLSLLNFSYLAVLSYNNLITHPLLSRSAIEVYNRFNNQGLTNQQADWIIQGSINEDADPRYLNHFYNPETDQGLNDTIEILGLKQRVKGASLIDWVFNQNSISGDYSYNAILKNYQQGDFKRAYEGIGHILHLTQDLAVPAHTRNDAHPDGDTYEKWVGQYGSISSNGLKIQDIADLKQSLKNLAGYTHDNFFSKDSVLINSNDLGKIYQIENVSTQDIKKVYLTKTLNNKKYKIAYSQNIDSLSPIFEYGDDFKIHADYWSLLSPQAVNYSAGVIDYFIKQFANIDLEKKQELSLLETLKQDLQAKNLTATLNNLKTNVQNLVAQTRYQIGDLNVLVGAILQKTSAQILSDWQNIQIFASAGSEAPIILTQNIQTKFQFLSLSDQAKIKSASVPTIIPQVLGIKIITKKEQPILKTDLKPIIPPLIVQDSSAQKTIIPLPLKTISKTKEIIYPPQETKTNNLNQITESLNQPIQPQTFYPLIFTNNSNSSNTQNSFNETINNIIDANENSNQNESENIEKNPILIAPETLILTAPPILASSTIAEFFIASDQEEVNFEVKLDNNDWEIIPSSLLIFTVEEGEHILSARAVKNNLADESPAQYNWQVDTSAPIINLLSAPTIFASSSQADFSFTSNEETAWNYNLDNIEQPEETGNILLTNLGQGSHNLLISAFDKVGNLATTSYNWLIDQDFPNVELSNLNSFYLNSDFNLNWQGSDLSASSSEVSEIDNYDLEYRLNSNDWTELANHIAENSLFYNLSTSPGSILNFRIRARDRAGNLSDWSEPIQTQIGTDHPVISEVQVSGLNADDEFIELYNPTNDLIDLSGWSIQYRGSGSTGFQKKNFTNEAAINPKNYYLIASTFYNSSIVADMTHSSFNLSGAGGNIFLVNNQNLLTDSDLDSNFIIDKLAYGKGNYIFPENAAFDTVPDSNSSLERKALAESNETTMLENENGNSYDLNNNSTDFILRAKSDPQNSSILIAQTDQTQDQENNTITWGHNNSGTIMYIYQSFIPQKSNLVGISLKICYTMSIKNNKDFKINICSGDYFSENGNCGYNSNIGSFSLTVDQVFDTFPYCGEGFREVYFDFGSGFNLIPGQTYHFQIYNSWNFPVMPPFSARFQDDNPYPDGKLQYRISPSSNLNTATTSDLWFKTYYK